MNSYQPITVSALQHTSRLCTCIVHRMMVDRMNDRNMSKIIIIIVIINIDECLVSGCFVRVDRIANGYLARLDYVAQIVRIVYCITLFDVQVTVHRDKFF